MSNTDALVANNNLHDLIRTELTTIPIEHWGFFFPLQVAVWRYAHTIRPEVFGEIDAGYDTEPYFRGQGAEWFVKNIGDDDVVVAHFERIMYPLMEQIPIDALDRGQLRADEFPPLDRSAVDELAERVTSLVAASQ